MKRVKRFIEWYKQGCAETRKRLQENECSVHNTVRYHVRSEVHEEENNDSNYLLKLLFFMYLTK